jgi:hypothetical protein
MSIVEPRDQSTIFEAYAFAIEDVANGAWYTFENLMTGEEFDMSELEARDLCAWLKARLCL